MKLTIFLIFLTSFGTAESIDCCDSLFKLHNSKTVNVKTCIKKSPRNEQQGINISIDNSHSANNYESGQSDSINISNPIIKKATQDDEFKWWADFFKPIIQLLIALVPLFILVFKYLTQKRKEFAEKIIESKRVAYSEFLKNFTETAVKIMHDKNVDTIKEDRDRMFARNQLLLYANDKVIQAYHVWVEYADKENRDINKEVVLFGKVLIEIRKDIHGESKVTEEEISNLNPFNRG